MKEGTFISQTKYTHDMLKKFDMVNAKPIKTPMETNGHLDVNEDGTTVDIKVYCSIIGLLGICPRGSHRDDDITIASKTYIVSSVNIYYRQTCID